MANPAGESNGEVLSTDFDRRLMLQFPRVGGHLRRWLARVPGTRRCARPRYDGWRYTRRRTHWQGHALVGMLRQSVFGRLAGYEDVNDAERLRHDPAMRWIVGGKAALGAAASPTQIGRFETRWLTAEKNLSASRRSFRPMDRSRA